MVTQLSIDTLRLQLNGELVPGNMGYADAAAAWNARYATQQPALVVYPLTPKDVSHAVKFALREGLGVAMMTTGHGPVTPADNALLLNFGRMANYTINPEEQTITIQPGLLANDLLKAIEPHGLTLPVGSAKDVSVTGLSFGGGLGWLTRNWGPTTDFVTSFKAVTADGTIITVSRDENPELFWGLRGGGGGNYVVVIEATFELIPLSEVYGFNFCFPVKHSGQLLDWYDQWASVLPDEWTTSFAMMHYPDLEHLPPLYRAKHLAEVRGCYCGPKTSAGLEKEVVRYWQKLNPLGEFAYWMKPSETWVISHDPDSMTAYVYGGQYFDQLDYDLIEVLAKYGAKTPSPLVLTELRQVGPLRLPRKSNSFVSSPKYVWVSGGFTPTDEALRDTREYVHLFEIALRQHMSEEGGYVNFMSGEPLRMHEAYNPITLEHLGALKKAHDPNNLFGYGIQIR